MNNNKSTYILYIILLLEITLTLNIEDAYAYDIGYLAGFSGEYTDNVERVRENPETEVINILSGRFIFLERSEKLDAYFDLGINKLDYINDLEEDRVDIILTSDAEWRLLRDRLTFRYYDYFTKTRIDTAANATPENQEYVNIFSIGPELQLPLGRTTDFITEYRYVNNKYEVSETDSDGSVLTVTLRHQSTPANSVSLNYLDDRLYYKNDVENQDTFIKSIYVGFVRETGVNYLTLELGQSLLQRDGIEDSVASTGAFLFERRVTPETSWVFDYLRSYADSTEVLSYSLGNQDDGITIETEAGSIFLIDRSSLSIDRANVYGAQRLYLYGAKIDYEEDISDRNQAGVRINYLNNFRQDMSLEIDGGYEGVKFTEIAREDRLGIVGLAYRYELQRNIFLGLTYLHEVRESTLPAEEYRENVYRLTLAYDTTDRTEAILIRTRRRTRPIERTISRPLENEVQN